MQVSSERHDLTAGVTDESTAKPLASKAGEEPQAGEVLCLYLPAGLDFDSNHVPRAVFKQQADLVSAGSPKMKMPAVRYPWWGLCLWARHSRCRPWGRGSHNRERAAHAVLDH